jgi:hypothetical protein
MARHYVIEPGFDSQMLHYVLCPLLLFVIFLERQVGVKSRQRNVGSRQVSVASRQGNVESRQCNVGSRQVSVESRRVSVGSRQVSVGPRQVNNTFVTLSLYFSLLEDSSLINRK